MTRHAPITAHRRILPLAPGAPGAAARPQPGAPFDLAFLVTEGFDALALMAAIEALRQANAAAPAPVARWQVLGAGGGPVLSAQGLPVLTEAAPETLLESPQRPGLLLLIGAPAPGRPAPEDRALSALLRRLAVAGVRLGACGGGIRALARAGLLEGESVAAHWSEAEALAEDFPGLDLARGAIAPGRRPTAPGGSTAADLVLHLLAQDLAGAGRQGDAAPTDPTDLVTEVADRMVLGALRNAQSEQTVSVQSRYGMRNPRLLKVLRFMEDNLEAPLSAIAIAEAAGMSVRQTERLFTRYVRMTPMAWYQHMRLDRAHKLLMQTEMSVTEVALACGFQSSSHFAKRYRSQFGMAPRHMRVLGAA